MSIPRSEHPNPQFMRKSWQNLNGCWEFEIDSGRSGIDRRFYERDSLSQSIIVPFCPESSLSGVGCKDFMSAVCIGGASVSTRINCQAEFFYTLVLWITKP